MKKMIKNGFRFLISALNKIAPKHRAAFIHGFPNIEASCVALADHLTRQTSLTVYFVIDPHLSDYPDFLSSKVNMVRKNSYRYFLAMVRSRYWFFTHGLFVFRPSRRQISVNLWHGIFYKPIGRLKNDETKDEENAADHASFTLSSSALTRQMFGEAFPVPPTGFLNVGYPRNDVMLRAQQQRGQLRETTAELARFKQVVVWLPTYRQSVYGELRVDGAETGNPFYMPSFDVAELNSELRRYDAVCVVKPHPKAPKYELSGWSHILFVDDKWLSDRQLTLYHLAGMSDLLLSDVSSIMIDYLLTGNPIICVSADMKAYGESRGFYFNPIESWIPSPICTDWPSLRQLLAACLTSEVDPFAGRRQALKNKFFDLDCQDDDATVRLLSAVLKK